MAAQDAPGMMSKAWRESSSPGWADGILGCWDVGIPGCCWDVGIPGYWDAVGMLGRPVGWGTAAPISIGMGQPGRAHPCVAPPGSPHTGHHSLGVPLTLRWLRLALAAPGAR